MRRSGQPPFRALVSRQGFDMRRDERIGSGSTVRCGVRGRRALTGLVLGCTACLGCLPGDTRPPPGEALVLVRPSEALLLGMPSQATADGWAISYRRLLLGLGDAELGGERCTEYSEADYDRIFDMLQPEPQKVNVQYALGFCELDYELVNPSGESLLGAGVSPEDAAFMRTPGSDDYARQRGVSLYAEGQATLGNVTKRFAWSFRWQVEYDDCGSASRGTSFSGVELRQGEPTSIELLIAGEALFQTQPDPELALLRFAPLADADTLTGNDDGVVTLEELGAVKLADLPPELGYDSFTNVDPRELSPRIIEEPTLQDHVYVGAFPNVARFPGGNAACQTEVRAGSGRNGF
jgi:hypothetical protein